MLCSLRWKRLRGPGFSGPLSVEGHKDKEDHRSAGPRAAGAAPYNSCPMGGQALRMAGGLGEGAALRAFSAPGQSPTGSFKQAWGNAPGRFRIQEQPGALKARVTVPWTWTALKNCSILAPFRLAVCRT